MSLLSKLFGKKVGDAAEKLMKDVMQSGNSSHSAKPTPAAPSTPGNSSFSTAEEGPSGDSWGPRMPAEENQFSYPGDYLSYFEHVYREEFPQYLLEAQPIPNRRGSTIVFSLDGRRVLLVELMSDRSVSRRLRNSCVREGIPYLRFYYDHPNWWNTRSYVVRRTRFALGL